MVRRNVYQSTDSLSIRYKELELLLELWQFFKLLLLDPEALSRPFSVSIIVKAKLMELLMLCHVFSLKESVFFELLCTEFLSAQRTSSFHYFSSGMHSEYSGIRTTQELATHFLPLPKFYRCALEEDVPALNQFDGWEDVKGVVHLHGLFYVLEIIKPELTTKKIRQFVARKRHQTLGCHLPISNDWKDTSHNSDGFAYVHYLKGYELRFDSHCHWLAYKDGIFQSQCRYSTAVTTYASTMRISRNLIFAYKKNL